MLTRGSARPTGGLSVAGIQTVGGTSPVASSGGLNPIVSLVPENATGASYVSTSDFVVPIAAPSTYVPLAPAVGNPWAIETDSSDFVLHTTGAQDGSLKYVGAKSKRFLIQGFATLFKAGGAVDVHLAIFVNGSIHYPVTSHMEVSTRRSTGMALPVVVVLNTNDVIDLRVSNESDADDLHVESAMLTAITGGIV